MFSCLSYVFNIGFILTVLMFVQVISGFLISLLYSCDVNVSYYVSVLLVRDVFFGYILSYTHCYVINFLFVAILCHIIKALSYGSYNYNGSLVLSGVVMYVLLRAISFLGYCIVFGSMSLWGINVMIM